MHSSCNENGDELLDALRSIGTATHTAQPASSMEEQLRRVSAVMEDDLVAIRQKVVAEREGRFSSDRNPVDSGAATVNLTEEEERKVYNELKSKHQVDLHDENNLAELEDKGLIDHIAQARRTLAEQEQKKTALPNRDNIRARHVHSKLQFSSLVQALESANMNLLCGVEEAFLQGSNTAKIAAGKTPHSFPEVPEEKPVNHGALATLSTKVDGAAKSCQAASSAIADAVNGIDVLRRECETVVDSLIKLVDHYRASHIALERLLGAGKGSAC
jgi:hypothetical protein